MLEYKAPQEIPTASTEKKKYMIWNDKFHIFKNMT